MALSTDFLPGGGAPTGAGVVARARGFFHVWRLALAAAIFAGAAAAAPNAPPPADYQAAKGMVEALVLGLIAEVRTNQELYTDDEELFALIRRRVLPMVDTAAFSRLALGRHWKSADDGQRRAFARAMESQMVSSYGKSLTLLLEVDRVRFRPLEGRAGGKYEVVKSSVSFKSNQPPLRIDYAVHKVGDGWRIFDLVIDGLSLVKQFRRSFDREIEEYGLAGLIERLGASSR